MLTGYLRSRGHKISENSVAKIVKSITPVAVTERRILANRQLNPKPYHADYFGQKVHIDQNEKLVMYGVTHVIARDGYSGMVVATSTMPIKNNLTIYEEIFRYVSNSPFSFEIMSFGKKHNEQHQVFAYGYHNFNFLRPQTSIGQFRYRA